jgi:SAM-dependent methyltransferase
MMVEQQQCRLCGELDVEWLGAIPESDFFAGRVLPEPMPGGHLWRCQSCESMFRHPIESADTYVNLYKRGAVEQWHRDSRRCDLALLRSLIGARAGQCAVLDLGCGTGDFLASLSPEIARFGVEPSSLAAAEAARRGIVILADLLENLRSEQRFDFITIIDVIEHVPSPAQLLDVAYDHLLPGGCLIVATGDPRSREWLKVFKSRFWYAGFPEHISFPASRFFQEWQKRRGAEPPVVVATRYEHLNLLQTAIYLVAQWVYFLSPMLLNLSGRVMQFLGRAAKPRRRCFIPGAPGVFVDHQVVTIRRPV